VLSTRYHCSSDSAFRNNRTPDAARELSFCARGLFVVSINNSTRVGAESVVQTLTPRLRSSRAISRADRAAEFLAEERQALGERWYRQEYLSSFEDTIDAVFAAEDIRAALSDDIKPLFAE
jgi:hypothetical protein